MCCFVCVWGGGGGGRRRRGGGILCFIIIFFLFASFVLPCFVYYLLHDMFFIPPLNDFYQLLPLA